MNENQNNIQQKEKRGFFSKGFVNILYGIIFVLIGALGFINSFYVGSAIFYGLSYVFGMFSYLVLVLFILLGLYLIISRTWPKFRITFSGLGFFLLFVFGCLASSIEVPELQINNACQLFNEKFLSLASGIEINIASAMQLNGGFLGYYVASLFLTGLGKIGSYVFTYVFLLVASVLLLRKPFFYLYHFIERCVVNKKVKNAKKMEKEDKDVDDEKIDVEAVEQTPSNNLNPFTESHFAHNDEIATSVAKDDQEDDLIGADSRSPLFRQTRTQSIHKETPFVPNDYASKNMFDEVNYSKSEPKEEVKTPREMPNELGFDTSIVFESKEEQVSNSYNKEYSQSNETVIDRTPIEEEKEEPQVQQPVNEKVIEEHEPVARTFQVEKPQYIIDAEIKRKEEEEASRQRAIDEENRRKEKEALERERAEKAAIKASQAQVPPMSTVTPLNQTCNDNYILPSINLLVQRQDFGKYETNQRDAQSKVDMINNVFQRFSIGAAVQSFTIGPTVTRFNIEREPGVKVSQITSLEEEMKSALNGDMSVRIEGVVRGQDTSGIEVANKEPTMVSFRDCFAAVMKSKDKLLVPLGQDISNEVITTSIDSLPHLLVSGTTGSGKSVFIHSIIMTLIMRNYPSELKFVLIDPKKVEFSKYHNMPHLYCPIVDDAVRAVATLKKLVAEMERRYTLLARAGVSKLQEYNELKETNPEMENLPNIVCVIDEFADLMAQDPKNVDLLTQRLAQKARSAGIYLIIATQRPTVNCITGTIKANIPSRVALSVSSSIDSRTIIDENGAELLVGKGDLLARVPQYKQLIRLQSAFVSNQEINAVVKYLKDQAKPCFNKEFLNFEEPTAQDAMNPFGDAVQKAKDDPLYEMVKDFVLERKTPSTSAIQRHFSIGYGRAASLLDGLESEGIIRTLSNGRRALVGEDNDEDEEL